MQSLWARKADSVVRSTRLADGAEALAACPPAKRKQLLVRFAELEKKTSSRRAALEERARAIVAGQVRKAEEGGKPHPTEEGGRPAHLTLAEEVESSADEDDVVRKPANGHGQAARVSVEEEELLRKLAEAEQRGYDRAQLQEKAQQASE